MTRDIEKREMDLLDTFECLGIDNVCNIIRMDTHSLKVFHEYLGEYIDKLEKETKKVSLEK